MVVLPSFPIAQAQDFGQWSWKAILSAGGSSRDNLRGSQTVSETDQRNVGLSMDLSGFIVHPAITRFKLGLDLAYLNTDSGQELDSDQLGFRSNFEILPRGDYSGSLYFNRHFYDYSGEAVENPFSLLSVPDTITSYGGRFRISEGWFKGTLLGVDRTFTDFLDPELDQGAREREYLDWGKNTLRTAHRFRLEHRFRELGTVDLEYDNYRLNLEERADISPTWQWYLTGSGTRQEGQASGTERPRVDDYQIRTRLGHLLRERDSLDFSYDFGQTRSEGGQHSESHGFTTSYLWRPNETWLIKPLISYARASSEGQEIRAPQAGLAVSWFFDRNSWDAAVTARGTYSDVEREVGAMTQDENQVARSMVATVGHGDMQGLKKDLELEWSHNRLRIAQSNVVGPPGLGLTLPGLGTDDIKRARVLLGHQWDGQFLKAWGDWVRQESEGLSFDEDFVRDSVSATMEYGIRRILLRATISESEVERNSGSAQSISSKTLSANWGVWRSLTIRGLYRMDDQELNLAPNIEGTQLEAGIQWQLGQFYLKTAYRETTQEFTTEPETTYRTLTWSISRRFGGWLPIVSGPRRRGVIR